MENPEQKLESSFSSIIPGFGKNKKPQTVEEAIAPIQETIDNLNSVCSTRSANAEAKAKQIKSLEDAKAVDEQQSASAEKLAKRLNDLLYGDDV